MQRLSIFVAISLALHAGLLLFQAPAFLAGADRQEPGAPVNVSVRFSRSPAIPAMPYEQPNPMREQAENAKQPEPVTAQAGQTDQAKQPKPVELVDAHRANAPKISPAQTGQAVTKPAQPEPRPQASAASAQQPARPRQASVAEAQREATKQTTGARPQHDSDTPAAHANQPQDRRPVTDAAPTPAEERPSAPAAVTSNVLAMQRDYIMGEAGAPDYSTYVPPAYPVRARREGRSGKVLLRVYINAEGEAEEVQVLSSSHPVFTGAARTSALRSSYVPLRLAGEAQACWVRIPISFNLME